MRVGSPVEGRRELAGSDGLLRTGSIDLRIHSLTARQARENFREFLGRFASHAG